MPDSEDDLQRGEDIVRVEHFREPEEHDETYKGLLCHTLPGLHAHMAESIGAALPKGARIVDLAAGSGAFSLRLTDLGFEVSACDYLAEGFKLHGTLPFHQANLNREFAAGLEGPYDGVVAIEIIEHLENPRNFIRQCGKLLAPGGRLFLSTPNIESPRSLETFLRKGTFTLFNDKSYQRAGHITPIGQWQLRKIFAENGFERVTFGSFLAPERRRLSVNGLRRAVVRAFSRYRKGRQKGDILVVEAVAGDG